MMTFTHQRWQLKNRVTDEIVATSLNLDRICAQRDAMSKADASARLVVEPEQS